MAVALLIISLLPSHVLANSDNTSSNQETVLKWLSSVGAKYEQTLGIQIGALMSLVDKAMVAETEIYDKNNRLAAKAREIFLLSLKFR